MVPVYVICSGLGELPAEGEAAAVLGLAGVAAFEETPQPATRTRAAKRSARNRGSDARGSVFMGRIVLRLGYQGQSQKSLKPSFKEEFDIAQR